MTSGTVESTRIPFSGDVVEFRFDAGGPIDIRELASSFAAIGAVYEQTTQGKERLAVVSLKTGSILATVAPFIPLMGQIVPAIEASLTLTDFAVRLKAAIDAFAGKGVMSTDAPDPGLSREIGELIKPLTGKRGASFGFARIKAKSTSGDRMIEIEAEYSSQDIDRAYINAERVSEAQALPVLAINDDSEPSLVRGVDLVLHQTNIGPAKERGQTGDRGVIATVSEKPLPLYFASTISNLKERLVRAKTNPLLQHLNVDAWVVRDNGAPKSYTIIEVHDGGAALRGHLPLLPRV